MFFVQTASPSLLLRFYNNFDNNMICFIAILVFSLFSLRFLLNSAPNLFFFLVSFSRLIIYLNK